VDAHIAYAKECFSTLSSGYPRSFRPQCVVAGQ
jgi:hypothetical protein